MTAALIPWPGFDVNHPSRVGAACRQINELLADGDWHPWKSIQTPVAADHNLQPATVYNLLQGMIRTGGIERTGHYNRRYRRDHRKVRLAAAP
jgi:DNA-binding IclR family transcriptional regulator